ncbi:MAG: glycyl-radical enzyme activating protein [Candidatus Lokiarchaeota archaeon]|nr:glycyl-radical enzyme activating protein [Candidatus Lokiarchaeota archaeon]
MTNVETDQVIKEDSTSKKGYIFEIQKMSTEDGPGIRTTVFFKQCPLRCIWCHNPESIYKEPSIQWFKVKCIGCKSCVEVCPESAITLDKKGIHIDREKCKCCGKCADECPSTALRKIGKYWSLEDLFHEVEKDKVYYQNSNGGITISGGEPTIQVNFVKRFLKKCKDADFHTALDTCGYTNKKILEELLPYVDLILFDIKEINSKKHEEFTGVPNDLILDNLKWLIEKFDEWGKKIWIRTPLIPHFTATEENIRAIGEFIVGELQNKIARWELLSFNNLAKSKYERMDIIWQCKDFELMTNEEVEHLFDIAKSTGVKKVVWSGMTKKN